MLTMPHSTLLVIGPDNTRQAALTAAFAPFGTTVVVDLEMPGFNRSALQDWAGKGAPEVNLILVTSLETIGRGHMQVALSAIPPELRAGVPVVFAMRGPSALEHIRATMSGASEIIDTRCSPEDIAARCHVLIELERDRRTLAAAGASEITLRGLLDAAGNGAPLDLEQTERTAGLMLDATRKDGVGRWMTTVAQFHDQTYRHSLLMAGITAGFMVALGVGTRDSRRMTSAAMVHDVGKALLPPALLDKPARLTEEEFTLVKKHPIWGYDMLRAQGETDPMLLSVTRHHHEMLDGSGYPDGLSASAISDHVRIATICDIFTALVEPRSYKVCLSAEDALVRLQDMGDKLDPDLLRIFETQFLPQVPSIPLKCPAEIPDTAISA